MPESEKTATPNASDESNAELIECMGNDDVRSSSEVIEINSSISDLSVAPLFRGCIDQFDGRVVKGWAFSSENILKPLDLVLQVAGTPVAKGGTRINRPDITRVVGLVVKAGFQFSLDDVSTDVAETIRASLKDVSGNEIKLSSLIKVNISGTNINIPFIRNLNESRVNLREFRKIFESIVLGGVAKKHLSSIDDILNDNNNYSYHSGINVIAYYLPQFHPFKENNEWWGTGFTEWTNVSIAKSFFKNHYQPHHPADFGFYDLRLDQVQRDQIDLAKRYGISGFCYYYYWFSGKTLMTLPIDRHVEQDYDFDFCLCWANESWSRRWDGSEHDVLIAQRHTHESDVEFIKSCIKYFKSTRYIKINGAPLLQIYRVSLMQDPVATIKRWREIVREEGFPDLHVCMVESFGLTDPAEYGCDSSCQFPPHGVVGEKINDSIEELCADYSGTIYSYAEIVRSEIARPVLPHMRFRAAMPSWDNTSRKGASGNVFFGSTPALFETWMRHLVLEACQRLPEGQRFVFINAWNEWAEGAHLEPDRKYGHANLRAVRNALAPDALALAPLLPHDDAPDRLAETRRYVESLITTNKVLTKLVSQPKFGLRAGEECAFVRASKDLLSVSIAENLQCGIDSLNGHSVSMHLSYPLAAWQGLSVKGWLIAAEKAPWQMLLGLRHLDNDNVRYVASILGRIRRPDVVSYLSLDRGEENCGFNLKSTLQGVAPGRYEIELLVPDHTDLRTAQALPTSVFLLIG